MLLNYYRVTVVHNTVHVFERVIKVAMICAEGKKHIYDHEKQ